MRNEMKENLQNSLKSQVGASWNNAKHSRKSCPNAYIACNLHYKMLLNATKQFSTNSIASWVGNRLNGSWPDHASGLRTELPTQSETHDTQTKLQSSTESRSSVSPMLEYAMHYIANLLL